VEIDKNIKSWIYTEWFARVWIKEVVGRFGN
jgi:hypothetical protein